jgi:hypothetical protein
MVLPRLHRCPRLYDDFREFHVKSGTVLEGLWSAFDCDRVCNDGEGPLYVW